jgi:fatty-acyl-CoA synthase
VVTHQNLIANSWAMMHDGLEVGDDDQGVSWLPLYHDMGLIGCMLAPLWCGLPMVFIPTVSFVKHPTLWMETVHRFRGTLSYAPNFAYALARRRTPDEKLKKLDLSCLKALGAAAEPNHPDTLRAFVEFFGRAGLKPGAILPSYGMAEATLAMTFCPMGRGLKTDRIVSDAYHSQGKAVPAGPEEPKEKVLEYVSCGSPFPSHRLKIVGEDGRELPERSMGEIVFGGPSVTAGYFEREEATREVFTEAGLHTGDLGYVADGELYVTGRKKDIIILNGRNYDPQTVEWEAAEVPGVRKGNVVAFSRPGVATEELVVVAEAKEGQALGDLARAVKLRIQENLFLTVTDVRLIGQGQLPKTTSGKLQRRRTREQYLEGTLGSEGVRTVGGRAEKLMLAKHLGRSMMARFRHGIRQRADVLFSALNGSERDAPAAEGREDGPEEHER